MKTRSNTNSVTLRDSAESNKQRAGLGYTKRIAEQKALLRSAGIQKTTPIPAPITVTSSAEVSEQLNGEQLNGEQAAASMAYNPFDSYNFA